MLFVLHCQATSCSYPLQFRVCLGDRCVRISRYTSKANKRVEIALREQNSHVIICILMERLYVLRNQLIHGGATWNSGKNRDQVVEGNTFIKDLVPCLIEIMLKNPNENWGDNNYPILYATKASLTSLAEKFSN